MPIVANFITGGGNSNVNLSAVTNIQTLITFEKVYIKWTDPEDFVVSGTTISEWGGALLVRKAGSVPKNRRDGKIVMDSKVRNAYAERTREKMLAAADVAGESIKTEMVAKEEAAQPSVNSSASKSTTSAPAKKKRKSLGQVLFGL